MELHELIRLAGETNEKNGYNGYAKAHEDGYGIDYLAKKDLLEVSELTEALDELRAGHSPAEVYLSWPDTPSSLIAEMGVAEAEALYRDSTPGKPEGYIIEKLDAIIRSMGTLYEVADTYDLDLEEVAGHLIKKIEYNAQRADTAASGIKKF